jgi:hypothetical protein
MSPQRTQPFGPDDEAGPPPPPAISPGEQARQLIEAVDRARVSVVGARPSSTASWST